MRRKQNPKRSAVTKRKTCYTKEALLAAWKAVQDGMTIYKACKIYGIPKQTLADRKLGKICNPTDTGSGSRPLFEKDHEKKLVSQIEYLAGLGYSYSGIEVLKLATDYAHTLSLLPPEKSLTNGWLNRFYERWPELDSLRPKNTKVYRKNGSITDKVKKYFSELKTVMDKYALHEKPHLIYSVDEIAINIYSTSGKVAPVRRNKTSATISTKSVIASLIACGNAVGSCVPPFIVFKGKTLPSGLSQRCSPGADLRISETGLSDSDLFMDFIKDHFVKFSMGFDSDYKLLLYNGHASHIDISLIRRAKKLNVILFVLPPHNAHLPLDVGCFGQFRRNLQTECEKTKSVSKQVLAEKVCKVYPKAFCHENLVSSYEKTGIYPLESFNSGSESATEDGENDSVDKNSESVNEDSESADEDSESADGDGESADGDDESVDGNGESADRDGESSEGHGESEDKD